jgi:carotenoid cleavage dioxygenase-like enzyme
MAAYDLGFDSITEEHTAYEPEIEGSIPDWLSGTLYRNGPGKFGTDHGSVNHWFDGLAMLQRYAFAGGDLSYSNRLLRTEAYETAHESGFSGQFATGGSYLKQLFAIFRGDVTDNANVHVARVDGEHVALTETPRGVAFDPETLGTRGDFRFSDDLSLQHVTAHYRRDEGSRGTEAERNDERGEYVGHGVSFGRTNEYVLYRVPDGERRRGEIARYPVEEPAYVHSIGLTPDHAIIAEPPFVVDPIDFFLPGGEGFVDYFEWKPDRGGRFLVFERESGDLAAEVGAEAFFVFHHVNAYEDEDGLVVDLVTYPDADIVTDLSMEALASGAPLVTDGELRRYRLDLDASGTTDAGGAVADRTDLYTGTELTRVSPEVRLRPYRYAYGQATHREGENGLVKVDVGTGEATEWFDDVYAEEPIFVPAPAGEREDAGVVLATVLDPDAERSFLLVLDGESFAERARAWLPHHLPFGFHGRFYLD